MENNHMKRYSDICYQGNANLKNDDISITPHIGGTKTQKLFIPVLVRMNNRCSHLLMDGI